MGGRSSGFIVWGVDPSCFRSGGSEVVFLPSRAKRGRGVGGCDVPKFMAVYVYALKGASDGIVASEPTSVPW